MGILSLRTLIVEDDPGYAELLKEMLVSSRDLAFTAECTNTLAEGLTMLTAGHFDLLLLDLHLPDAKGPAACEAVRAMAPLLPIVVVSASLDEEGMAEECLQRGAQDYLVKGDFDQKHLMHSLRYAAQRKKIEAASKATQSALVEANRALIEKVRELDQLNAIMMGREERILEMKDEIKALKEKLLKGEHVGQERP
jgi:CheY-like chemotaxis protein